MGKNKGMIAKKEENAGSFRPQRSGKQNNDSRQAGGTSPQSTKNLMPGCLGYYLINMSCVSTPTTARSAPSEAAKANIDGAGDMSISLTGKVE